MNRILYSSLLVLFIFFSKQVSAQCTVPTTITPNNQCYSSVGTYTMNAGIFQTSPGANSYSWVIQPINGTTCQPTYTLGQHGAPLSTNQGSQIAVTFPCCGDFSLTIIPFFGSIPTGVTGCTVATIFCPTGGSVSVSPSVACMADSLTFTGTGGGAPNSYTWSNGAVGNPIKIAAVTNTCMTFTATTIQGCTISPAPACASVQAISLSVSPAAQTICATAPICLTSNAQAINNASTAPGTSVIQVDWYDPNGILTANVCTVLPIHGTWTAIATHTGAAGTCTFAATANVFTATSISASIIASSPSVCPGATVQLTGVSVATAATSYTWFRIPSGFPFSVANNSIVTAPGPGNYSVNVNYFGCPGTATLSVGTLSLYPTLTANSLSICPGGCVTFTAGGALSYTFRSHTPFTTVFGTGTTNIRTHCPTVSPPILYSVQGFSNGCVGTASLTILTRTLYPTLTLSSPSVCPGTQFTLCPGNVGAGTFSFLPSGPPTYTTSTSSLIKCYETIAPSLPHTYTLIADSVGCKGTATVTVNELVLQPTLTASAYSICPGTAVTFSATGGALTTYSFFGPGSTLLAPASTNSTLTHTTVTSPSLPHTYTVVTDSAGCTGADSVKIHELNLSPLINYTISPSNSICPGTSFTVNASASGGSSFNYTFVAPPNTNLPNLTANSASHSPPSLAPPPTYTILADSSTCKGSTTFNIFERKIFPTLVASDSLVCAGMPVTLTAQGVGYGSLTTYTFATLVPAPVILPGGGQTFSFVTHNPTVQTVYIVDVDSAGCKATIPPTFTVNIRPALVLNLASSAASVCPGLSATLAASGPTYVTWPISYTWTQTQGTGTLTPYPAPADSAQVWPVTNSTYSVFALDSLGCIGSATIDVGVDPNISFPVLISSSGSTICAGQNVTLTATHTVNTIGGLTYTWSPPIGTLSTIYSPSVIVQPSTTLTYSVLVMNPYGCVSGASYTVPVGQYPNPSIVATSTGVCAGFTSTLTAFGANSYSWTGTTFTNVVAQQSISVLSGQYTVLASNGGGCTNTAWIKIDSLPNLTIKISQTSATTCIESNNPKFSKPVTLTATGASEYVWFPYNQLNMTYSIGPKTDVRPPSSTCYTVNGSTSICSGTGQICVNVIPQFTMNVVPPLPAICINDSIKLSIVNVQTGSVGAVGPTSSWTYSWTEAENAPPISLTNNLTQTVMAFPQNTTTYTVEVRDSRKCVSLPRLVTVTVLPRPITAVAIPTINSVATNSLCYVGLNPGANDVTINLMAVNKNTGLQFGVVPSYTWISPYGSQYNSILTPSNAPGITVSAPVKAPSIATYSVISGYNGIPGCSRIDTVSVRVVDCRPVRDVKFATVDVNDTICARNCITFTNLTDTMAGGPQKLEWSFPGGSPSTSTLNFPTVCYNLPGKYNVILKVISPYPIQDGGSSQTIGQLNFVKVVDVPNVTIIAPGQSRSDTTVRFGQTVNLNGSGALTYEWSPNYNISSLTNPSVKVNPFKTTQYILTGYNSKTCFSSDTLNVIVIEDCGEMYIPNAFTPNNDGVNDILYVRGICLQTLNFMIFNRWGEKVFETMDQARGWDGTYKGQEMNTGVFVYRLEGKTYDGKSFQLKGNITLLR